MAQDQDVHRERFYKKYLKIDPHTNWIYQPHTVTLLLAGIAIGTYIAFTRQETSNYVDNSKMGLIAGAMMFLLFSAIQFKDGLFYRPHPVIWRIITGAGVLYLCALVFLLFQNVNDARQLMKHLDPKLGVPLPERSYADDCTLYTPDDKVSKFRNLYDTVNDEFIVAHFLGWFAKAILLRDYWFCWALSIYFELLEYTFEHMLPNFKECWWDHLILDILVCNWAGFVIGIKVMDFFRMKQYSFITPSVDEYHWAVLTSFKRMFYALALILFIGVVELNAFFLKFILWIPPPHPINIFRLFLWWCIGMPGVREFYHWVSDKNCKKFGISTWLCVGICVTEILICVKMGQGMFPAEHPQEVIIPWTVAVALFALWCIWFYGIRKPSKSVEVSNVKKTSTAPQYITKSEKSEKSDKKTNGDKPSNGIKQRKGAKI